MLWGNYATSELGACPCGANLQTCRREVQRAVPSSLASLSLARLFGLRVAPYCYDIEISLASFIENASTPDGKPDPSIFSTRHNREGIRVGTSVGLMVRKDQPESEPTVRFRQFWGTNKRADLLQSLEDSDGDASYEVVNPQESNRYSFRPSEARAEYLSWPKLTELSAMKSDGLWIR